MSESASPGFPANASTNDQAALTPEAIESILADFRSWLEQLAVAHTPPPPPTDETVDLATLVGQFVALRHEVNLQTRAVRAQQEQNTETLRQLTEALEALEKAASAGPEQSEENLRPLLKTLIDLYDALSLTGRELERTRRALAPLLDGADAAEPGSLSAVIDRLAEASGQLGESARPSLFGFGRRSSAEPVRQVLDEQRQNLEKIRTQARGGSEMFDSLLTGYQMSLQRVERALAEHGLEPIPTVGEPFDPEQMEALEVVTGSGRGAGEVIEEVRRGYLWNGRVFRFALVRVTRS